jgi:tetratricopeptide (TPR) repeat protein
MPRSRSLNTSKQIRRALSGPVLPYSATAGIVGTITSRLHLELRKKNQGPIKHQPIRQAPGSTKMNSYKVLNGAQCFLIAMLIAIVNSGQQLPAMAMHVVNLPQGQKLDERLAPISALLDQGLYRQAVENADALIKQSDLSSKTLSYAYCLRGIARSLIGQLEGAIADIDRGLKLNPKMEGRDDLYGIRATSLLQLNRYEEAIASLTQSLSCEPSSIAFRLRGQVFLRLRQYQSALKDFDQALEFWDCPADVGKLKDQATQKMLSQKQHADMTAKAAGKSQHFQKTSAHRSSVFVCRNRISSKPE